MNINTLSNGLSQTIDSQDAIFIVGAAIATALITEGTFRPYFIKIIHL